MLDTIVVVTLLIAAFTYFIYSQVKKFKRLSAPTSSSCGGNCESCPFAVNCPSEDKNKKKPKKKKSGGCGCGCGG